MNWLRAKSVSSGSARDISDVAVDGVDGGSQPAAPLAGVDEVKEMTSSPLHIDDGEKSHAKELTGSEGVHTSGFAGMSRAELAGRLFDNIDKSGDRALSKEELTPALLVLLPSHLSAWFDHLLTFAPQGIGYSKDKAEEIFDSIDDDASNQISKDEFVSFFERGNDELFRKLRYAGIKTKLPKNVPVIKTGTAGPARASNTALALQEVGFVLEFRNIARVAF